MSKFESTYQLHNFGTLGYVGVVNIFLVGVFLKKNLVV